MVTDALVGFPEDKVLAPAVTRCVQPILRLRLVPVASPKTQDPAISPSRLLAVPRAAVESSQKNYRQLEILGWRNPH